MISNVNYIVQYIVSDSFIEVVGCNDGISNTDRFNRLQYFFWM
jgi:hypothetical protein